MNNSDEGISITPTTRQPATPTTEQVNIAAGTENGATVKTRTKKERHKSAASEKIASKAFEKSQLTTEAEDESSNQNLKILLKPDSDWIEDKASGPSLNSLPPNTKLPTTGNMTNRKNTSGTTVKTPWTKYTNWLESKFLVNIIKLRKTLNNKSVPKVVLAYCHLMRLDRPIGIMLLLWPTLWALWLAAKGVPSFKNLIIFTLGVILMRSAGCVINDFADRNIDTKVKRTRNRPLATGTLTSKNAISLFITLCVLAFILVLFTDPLTIKLSIGGLILAFCYPFMKRYTHLPQVILGAAFGWAIPMAYAAEAGVLHPNMWLIYLAVVLWTVMYDTFYAMVDRDDDIKIGVKSTAILFGEQDRIMTGILQLMTLYGLVLVGMRFELGGIYHIGLGLVAGLFTYQQYLIRQRRREDCFKAFLNNNWVGAIVFIGIALDLALK